MDAKRFDTLARTLGSSTSRRQVLRAVVGAAAGGVLGALGLHRLVAADESESDVAGTPTPTSEPTVAPEPSPTATPSPSPTATVQPTVTPDPTPESEACPEGRTPCGDTCADLAFEQEHCGACGAACGGGTLCAGGACACFPGAIACGGECVNPFCDPTNCGGCGGACAAGEACIDGACAPAPSNWTAVPVPASFGWVDSGVDVAAGQTLGIRANGVVAVSPGDSGRPPVGTRGCLASPRAPAPDLACHALVGRIGGTAPFELGYGTGFVAPSSGRLLLGVNDDSPEDNAGAFTAFVTVSEGTPTEPTSTPTAVAPSKGGGKTPTGAQAATTSCAGTGAACASNAACCSGVCVNGTCKASRVALGGVCDETPDCASPLLCRSGQCCKDVPQTCGANGDCCSGSCVNGSCCKPSNSSCGPNNTCCPGSVCAAGVCCRPNGSSCPNNAHCCSGICVSGVCLPDPVPLGGVCDNSDDCVSGLLCRSGQCCKDVPLACGANGDCCSGVCQNGQCCKDAGAACAGDSECCSGACVDGVCKNKIVIAWDGTAQADCEMTEQDDDGPEQSVACPPGSVIYVQDAYEGDVIAADASYITLTGDPAVDEPAIDDLIQAVYEANAPVVAAATGNLCTAATRRKTGSYKVNPSYDASLRVKYRVKYNVSSTCSTSSTYDQVSTNSYRDIYWQKSCSDGKYKCSARRLYFDDDTYGCDMDNNSYCYYESLQASRVAKEYRNYTKCDGCTWGVTAVGTMIL